MDWYDEWFDKYGVNDIGLTHAPESINTRIICRIYNHKCDYCPLKHPCFKKKKSLIPFACLDKYYAAITPKIEEKYNVYEDYEVGVSIMDFVERFGKYVEKWWRRQWASESFTIYIINIKGMLEVMNGTGCLSMLKYGRWLKNESKQNN